jgi:hypothetical protein
MTSKPGARKVFPILFVAAATFVIGMPRRAEAQWGGGFGGFGWGFGGFSQVPKPESFINSKALIDAGRDTHIPSRNVYANDPNSYINHIRDNGFVERYDVARREPSHYRYAQPLAQSRPGVTPTAMNVAQQMPSLPLDSFYDPKGQIVWPADSPVAGDLKEKRTVFDQVSQLALAETKKNGVASIATVTDARQKLLDYGRPALHYVRTHETPRVADGFHLFLLSMYESLAQAVNPAPRAAAIPVNPSAPPSS